MALVLFAALAAAAFAASTDFAEPASSPETTGVGPVGVVAGKFDGDSTVDLATANVSGGNVTVLLNDGAADFTEAATSPEGAGDFPSAITAADFDGNGTKDIAVANQVSDDATILLNDGSADFTEPATSPVAAGDVPAGIVAADFNGDGRKDLAVADHTATNNVTILKNKRAGKFVAFASSPETAGNYPSSLVATDIDRDGDKDLAVANQQSGNVTILLNNGSGNFTEPATSPETAGTFPQGIAAADLNGDGYPDLAVANQGSPSNVTILHNKHGSGDFVQPATSPVATGARPFAVVAADFDRDGLPDLATANHDDDNVTVLHNDGSFVFTEPATSPEGAADGPWALTAARLDGNSSFDLAVAANAASKLTVLLDQ